MFVMATKAHLKILAPCYMKSTGVFFLNELTNTHPKDATEPSAEVPASIGTLLESAPCVEQKLPARRSSSEASLAHATMRSNSWPRRIPLSFKCDWCVCVCVFVPAVRANESTSGRQSAAGAVFGEGWSGSRWRARRECGRKADLRRARCSKRKNLHQKKYLQVSRSHHLGGLHESQVMFMCTRARGRHKFTSSLAENAPV